MAFLHKLQAFRVFSGICAVDPKLEGTLHGSLLDDKNNQFWEHMFDQGPRQTQFKFNNLFNKQFLKLGFFFLKVFCRVKTGEVEVDCYLMLVGGGGRFEKYLKLVLH